VKIIDMYRDLDSWLTVKLMPILRVVAGQAKRAESHAAARIGRHRAPGMGRGVRGHNGTHRGGRRGTWLCAAPQLVREARTDRLAALAWGALAA
jgi:hypothetical protein